MRSIHGGPQQFHGPHKKGMVILMNEQFLTQTRLFHNIAPADLRPMLECLGAEQKRFEKSAVIYRAGDIVRAIGLVLSGRVQVENDDFWGNKSVLASIGVGETFAETYAFLPQEPMLVNVVAAEACDVLFLNAEQVIQTCPDACPYHSMLVRNLLMVSAQKNLELSRRSFHTAPKTIRGRVLSYLSFQAAHCGSQAFSIPFNRQQLADYLSVDRSALSNELGKMQREGLLMVTHNRFCLKADHNGNEL